MSGDAQKVLDRRGPVGQRHGADYIDAGIPLVLRQHQRADRPSGGAVDLFPIDRPIGQVQAAGVRVVAKAELPCGGFGQGEAEPSTTSPLHDDDEDSPRG